jgi:hypothetical protein
VSLPNWIDTEHIVGIATVTLAIITVIYVIITGQLLAESVCQRRAVLRPILIFRKLTVAAGDRHVKKFTIEVVNAGSGPALNIVASMAPRSIQAHDIEDQRRFSLPPGGTEHVSVAETNDQTVAERLEVKQVNAEYHRAVPNLVSWEFGRIRVTYNGLLGQHYCSEAELTNLGATAALGETKIHPTAEPCPGFWRALLRRN